MKNFTIIQVLAKFFEMKFIEFSKIMYKKSH